MVQGLGLRVRASQKSGYLFRSSHHKDYGNFGIVSGSPYLWKLPHTSPKKSEPTILTVLGGRGTDTVGSLRAPISQIVIPVIPLSSHILVPDDGDDDDGGLDDDDNAG